MIELRVGQGPLVVEMVSGALLRLENWSFTSQPEAFVDVHHMWSLQSFEGCLQSLRTEAHLGRGRQRCATNKLCHSSVTAQGRNQGVGSSSCCMSNSLGKYVPLCRKGFNTPAKRRVTANPWINVSKDAEEPFNAFPKQNKMRLLSNKQHKRHSKKPRRTSLVFEQNLPSSRNKHFRKSPNQRACRPCLAKRLHSVLW